MSTSSASTQNTHYLKRVRNGFTRVCKNCGVEQPIENFESYIDPCGNTQHKFVCNTCKDPKKPCRKISIPKTKLMNNPPIVPRKKSGPSPLPPEEPLRICDTCNTEKLIEEFPTQNSNCHRHKYTCKKCYYKKLYQRQLATPHIEPPTRVCNLCHKEKPIDEFYRVHTWHEYSCKKCRGEYESKRKTNAKNPNLTQEG